MFIKKHISQEDSSYGYLKLSDVELIVIYKEGREEAFDILFNRYVHLVFAISVKYLRSEERAKDASMEVFNNLQNKLVEHEINNFKSWLYTLVKNHCLMKLRSEAKIKTQEINDYNLEFSSDNCTVKEVESRELKYNILLNCLSRLKNEQKVCLELMYLKNHSYQDISDITGYTFKNVKSFIQNGKRNLKNMLEGHHEFIIET